MRSPFPGMDPYLEARWPGLHLQLAASATAELNRLLPEDLAAQPEERVAIGTIDEPLGRAGVPDVIVYEPGVSTPAEGGVALLAPYKLVVDVEPAKERFIRIISADDGHLITVIEFISPANKAADGLAEYHRKRDDLLRAGVQVVEIDLVRRGNWRGLLRPHVCPVEAVTPYRVSIRMRGGRDAYLFPMSLRQPLPSIPIPLRPQDKPVQLALQPLLEQVYENGRYGRTLNYSMPPEPPLDEDDAEWAAARLRVAGKKGGS